MQDMFVCFFCLFQRRNNNFCLFCDVFPICNFAVISFTELESWELVFVLSMVPWKACWMKCQFFTLIWIFILLATYALIERNQYEQ